MVLVSCESKKKMNAFLQKFAPSAVNGTDIAYKCEDILRIHESESGELRNSGTPWNSMELGTFPKIPSLKFWTFFFNFN